MMPFFKWMRSAPLQDETGISILKSPAERRDFLFCHLETGSFNTDDNRLTARTAAALGLNQIPYKKTPYYMAC